MKSREGNFMMDIPCDSVDWDWLEERFRGKRIIKKETKDSDGDRVVVDSPKFLLNGAILYVTLA